MKNGLGIVLKSFVVFKVKLVVKKCSIYYGKIHERMLKSYVEIEFKILSVTKHFKAQYLEFNFYITLRNSFMIFFCNKY